VLRAKWDANYRDREEYSPEKVSQEKPKASEYDPDDIEW